MWKSTISFKIIDEALEIVNDAFSDDAEFEHINNLQKVDWEFEPLRCLNQTFFIKKEKMK